MDQIFITVKILKNGKVHCIDKDILDCTQEEINSFYNSVSKGRIAGILNRFIEDKRR